MKLKIVNRRRFLFSFTILIIIAICTIGFGFNNTFSREKEKVKEKYISKGDTLWQIALEEKDNNKYFRNKDIRLIIDEIKEFNHLKCSDIKEGDYIRIPFIEI